MRLILGGRLLPLAAAVLAALALLVAPAHAAAPSFDGPGPYKVSFQVQGDTTLYYPSDIAKSPRRHPVIVWGNGTFAIPVIYDGLLRHWASHGFIVAAANTAFSGSGQEMRAGIDLLAKADKQSGSPFHGKVDLKRIGASGHSQGGAGTVNAAQDPRIITSVPIQPGGRADPSRLHGPTLYLAGQYDVIVSPASVRSLYESSGQVPAIYAERAGATHFTPLGDGGDYRGITTAWFRLQLMGDERARGLFFGDHCGICSSPAWPVVTRNAKAEQVPGPSSALSAGR
ncbi:poly(ethylene terephthalate) hydrolase family protein [Actinomadura macrotermitis]|uniref:poly(ethylene terephthalate) hydrolase n=1 Tax=Actinomadura macrotermitis TaxID=2585200 RepID=A0A7K0BY86_9ACTN|nr:acetylxylan esterase [Actinomadura macrotermitis]MQY05822.1 hypothetical protein [Actinomadura macrotermitis]